MSPTPRAPGSVRSSAEVNADIRALWSHGRPLTGAEQERYRWLLVEWAAAVRAERVPVAA